MNAQLAQRMRSAHQVSAEAYPHFYEAVTLQEEADIAAAKSYKTRKWISIVAVVVVSCLPYVGVPAAIALGVYLYNDYKKGGFHDSVEAARQEGYDRAEEARRAGVAIMDAHDDVLEGLYGDYCTPVATEYLMNVTAAGRVDTLNDALFMCDEYLHRMRIEEANANMVAEQQAQSESLRGIRKSSAISAVANVTNTVFNIASQI
ncbi:MAG: hypothetical protein IJH42_05450 [Atopobiaceae bacterium]|nr:hypothetical protein [Atopobiaceae bacterium]